MGRVWSRWRRELAAHPQASKAQISFAYSSRIVSRSTHILQVATGHFTSDTVSRRTVGEWLSAPVANARLGGATKGLVGLGNIRSSVTEKLRPFGSRVLYTARHPVDPSVEQRLALRYASLDDLLAGSSIVSLHVPLTAATKGFIDDAALAKMRDGAFLINTSRGGLVDETALRRALVSGKLGEAGLDVLHEEHPGGDPFVDVPRVIVTPHIAGSSHAAFGKMLRMAMSNIAHFLSGKPALDLIPGLEAP